MMRLGTSSFVNARPLSYGLEAEPGVTLIHAAPARLADLLRLGELDAALVSSSEYFTGNYRLIPGQALSSARAGADACLYSNLELHQLQRVALDGASLSTNLLLRLVLHWLLPGAAIEYAIRPQDALRSLAEFDACVLIGDAALEARDTATRRLELAALWYAHTGLPMVFSVWLARMDAPAEVDSVVYAASHRGMRALDQIAQAEARRLHWDEVLTYQYLHDVLDYTWSEQHLQSLALFQRLLAEAGIIQLAMHQVEQSYHSGLQA